VIVFFILSRLISTYQEACLSSRVEFHFEANGMVVFDQNQRLYLIPSSPKKAFRRESQKVPKRTKFQKSGGKIKPSKIPSFECFHLQTPALVLTSTFMLANV